MTYSSFVDTLSNGFSMFYNGLITLANVMIHNYLIITLLGVSLFISLVYLFINNILTIPFNRKDKVNLDNVRSDNKWDFT